MRKPQPIEPQRVSGWYLTEHVCRFCAARVLTRDDGSFSCSTCGASTKANVLGPAAICGCGMLLGPVAKTTREKGRLADRKPRDFHCIANPAVTGASPAKFVIAYLDAASA
jgi:hypothetical protein